MTKFTNLYPLVFWGLRLSHEYVLHEGLLIKHSHDRRHYMIKRWANIL